MYLLDTNVVSELRKAKKSDHGVRTWAQTVPALSLYVSAISILELEIGILLMERRDGKQGAVLRAWMDSHVLPAFEGRVLAIDTAVAQRCAALHVPSPRSDRDALIAARTLVHGMTVVTRNVDDFQAASVAVVNPGNPERRVLASANKDRNREIPRLRRPTRSQERTRKKKRRPASLGMTMMGSASRRRAKLPLRMTVWGETELPVEIGTQISPGRVHALDEGDFLFAAPTF